MKKVIVKCKLSSKETFEKKLSEIGLDFSGVHWQHDRIYVPREYKKNANYPRLIMRTDMESADRPAKYSLVLKRHIKDSSIDIVEEAIIKDYEKMVNIILQLGFKPFTEVSRRRQVLVMGEGVFICLDKIDNLPSYYAKIEANLAPEDYVAEAKNDLESTFKTLGETNFIENPYFELINQADRQG